MPGHNNGPDLWLKENPLREQNTRVENCAPTDQGSRKFDDQLGSDPQALGGIPPLNTSLLMMKIITWNIRGLNGRSKQRILRDCIIAEKPDILLLQETKCRGAEAETIFQCIWRECNSITTDSTGASGGLAILWNPSNIIISKPFSTIGTIMAHFEVIVSNQEGAITNVYGPHNHQDKDKFIERLELIKTLETTQN